ncbi:hypothetical protein CAG99_09750 [Streptomyces marincola]|uniref:Translation elongation factor EFG/EF2 domain-containing protein n=1 Tax=Streptomyces marincola TaxID=2878388 RepID=A0A1W7CWL6_9ACTN|nr:hypothetical protein CAG99_09750 [Streptomyces marincola]
MGALAVADFEPLPPDRGLEFVDGTAEGVLPAALGAAFGRGVLGRFRAWSFDGRPPYAVRVRLRDARWRPGEGAEEGFFRAGRRAAVEASRCVHHGVAPRVRVLDGPGPTAAPRPAVPARAVRGVHVRRMPAGACGGWALGTADFEPLPDDSGLAFAFVCELDEAALPSELAEGFERGVADVLYGADRLPSFGFLVRLREAAWHEVDSGPPGFEAAGRRAAAEALRCLAEGGEPRPSVWPARPAAGRRGRSG